MRNGKIFIVAALIAGQIFSGCGEDDSVKKNPPQKSEKVKTFDLSDAKDGTYSAESSRDDKLGYSKLTLTIQDHKITDAKFEGVDLFGNVKNEDYGSLTGKDSADYKKAQVAVKAINDYPKQLLETQNLGKVDAISGATISYGQFVETAQKAVAEARK